MTDNSTQVPAIEQFLADVRTVVESRLEALVPSVETEPRRLHEAVRWSLFGGGKRVRPAILLAVGGTFEAEWDHLIATSAAIEMIHTYSLIHDDLPAMDDDDLRRGRATCHKQFDEATAILAGDVLQTLAFKAVADDENLAAETRIRLISLIAAASGTPNGMVAGQQLDLAGEGCDLDLGAIRAIHRRKTGALITAAAQCGAIIGNASDEELAAVAEYADKLGLLFQITDDLLDATQTTEELGKTAGKDASVNKATYISLLGVDETKAVIAHTRDEACYALARISHRDSSLLAALAHRVANRTK